MDTILYLLSALVVVLSSGAIGHRIGRRKSSYETLIFKQLQSLNMKAADLVTGLQGLKTKVDAIAAKITGADADPAAVAAFTDLSTAVDTLNGLVPDPAPVTDPATPAA